METDEGRPKPLEAITLYLRYNQIDPLQPSVVVRVTKETGPACLHEMPFPQAVSLLKTLGDVLRPFLESVGETRWGR